MFTISNLSKLRGKISCTSVSISHDAKEAAARVTTTLLHVDAETRGTRWTIWTHTCWTAGRHVRHRVSIVEVGRPPTSLPSFRLDSASFSRSLSRHVRLDFFFLSSMAVFQMRDQKRIDRKSKWAVYFCTLARHWNNWKIDFICIFFIIILYI